MGKKSREKRVRRLARKQADPDFMLREFLGASGLNADRSDQKALFQECLEATSALLHQYKRLDAAIALCISELWPANTGSPFKHIFAWGVLLGLSEDNSGKAPIANYADFKAFMEALYATWPEFPMLEDFSIKADWGQTKVRLGRNFVPMFYGSVIERTPDFVEAFRITYAHIPEALAHMDLAIAMQAQVIEAMPNLGANPAEESQKSHIEVPPKDFWQACKSTLEQVGSDIAEWRDQAKGALDTRVGAFKAPLTWNTFGSAAMQGTALPFLAVESDGIWIPMSARSGPAVVIDHWANKALAGGGTHTHESLARFVAERYQGTLIGPITLFVSGVACEDLPVSCAIADDSGVYLICACDRSSTV